MKNVDQTTVPLPFGWATWGFKETSAYLGCTEGTLRVWTSKRKVPFVRVGRLVRFRKQDLDAWLDSNAVEPNGDGII
jgi:excisionase family DNA binding protein